MLQFYVIYNMKSWYDFESFKNRGLSKVDNMLKFGSGFDLSSFHEVNAIGFIFHH